MGVSSALIRRVFGTFARRRERSSSWSRVLGEAPERRVDALVLFSGLALTCRSHLREKLSILFYVFDSGETGVLTEDDLGAMISSCASVLRHLKLSLPISNDEAAFAAGAAFGRQQSRDTCSTTGGGGGCERECDVDEIDLPFFLMWAQRAELPSYALEILALPHRLSNMVDLVSGKARSTFRERYFPENAAASGSSNANSTARKKVSSDSASNQSSTKRRLPTQRSNHANMLPLLQGGGGSLISQPHALLLYLGRIGPHSANALFEVGPSSFPTASDSWIFVVSVEERCGSRFSVVDSQPLNVRVGEPGVLLLANLRAATDHRLYISSGVATERRQNGDVKRIVPRGQQTRAQCTGSTLRFTTLPADSLMASPGPDSKGNDTSSPKEKATSPKPRRCIELVSAWQQEACTFGAAQRLQPYPANVSTGHTLSSKGVSVLIIRGQRTCLESAERNREHCPWWSAAAQSAVRNPDSSDQTDARVLVQSWPLPAPASNHEAPTSPTTKTSGDRGAFSSVSGFAPFCGEAVVRNEEKSVAWARGGEVESEGIDVMVHVSPDWRAVKVLQRCFRVLRQCRFESPSVREDGRRMVSAEVHKAVRSLATRCFRASRGAQWDGARRSCAHIVLGDMKNPWLGLKEASKGQFSLDPLEYGCHRFTSSASVVRLTYSHHEPTLYFHVTPPS